MDLTEYETRKGLISGLSDMGITGEAAEALARETAEGRHKRRVAAATSAADKGVFELHSDALDESEYKPLMWPQYAIFLCVLDAVGVGGKDGCGGEGTQRVAAFRALGKGRKKATDGGAWSAAILTAGRTMLETAGGSKLAVGVLADGTTIVVSVDEPAGGSIVFGSVDPTEARWRPLLPWLRTLAREALRRAVGLDPWCTLPDWVSLAPTAGAWASTVNAIEAEISKDTDKQDSAASVRPLP